MDNIYRNIEKYNPDRQHEILTIFDNTIAEMLSNKRSNPTVTELFIRGRKQLENISVVILTQSYLGVPNSTRLNSKYYSIKKSPNKEDLQRITFNYSSHIDYDNLLNLYTKFTAKPFSLLLTDTSFAPDNL